MKYFEEMGDNRLMFLCPACGECYLHLCAVSPVEIGGHIEVIMEFWCETCHFDNEDEQTGESYPSGKRHVAYVDEDNGNTSITWSIDEHTSARGK